MAARKKPAAPKSTPSLRGVALVDAVIARITQGKGGIEVAQLRPMRAEDIASLRFANGAPLPPSLQRFLAFDTTWLRARFPGWNLPALEVATVARLVDRTLGAFATAFQPLPPGMTRGLALGLDAGSDSMRLLFLGATDEHGEYPVLGVDVDDEPNVVVAAPGFDVWLAQQAGLVRGLAGYAEDVRAQQKRNLGGRARLEALGPEVAADLDACDGDVAADVAWVQRARSAPRPALPHGTLPALDRLPEAKLLAGWLEARAIAEDEAAASYLAALRTRFAESPVWKARALDLAVRRDDVPLVRDLLALGAPPDKALVDAVRYHAARVEMVEALLEGAPGSDATSSALVAAAGQHRADLVRALARRGADVNRVEDRMTALAHACVVDTEPRDVPIDVDAARAASLETVKALLEHGARVDGVDTHAPLSWAVRQRNVPLVELLLAHGADPAAPDPDGDDALLSAWRLRAMDVFDVLRAHGARRDRVCREGFCLDDVTSEDGRLPRKLDVRVSLGEAPQKLTLRLRLLHAGTESPTVQLTAYAAAFVQALASMAESGLAGSDVFSPDKGHGRALTDFRPLLASLPSTYGGDVPREATLTAELELGGVSPAALGLWLHALCNATDAVRVVELELSGGDHGASDVMVDAGVAGAFVRGDRRDPLRAFPGQPARVLERAAAGTLAAITFAEEPDARWASTLASVLCWVEHRARGRGGFSAHVCETPGPGWAPERPTVSFEVAPRSGRLEGDSEERRAVLTNGVHRWGARVASVAWSG